MKPLWERALANRDALLSDPVYLEALARVPRRGRPRKDPTKLARPPSKPLCKRCGLHHAVDAVNRCKPLRDDWREINEKTLADGAERERQRYETRKRR